MICHNCGEDIAVRADNTCPICGVLQNIVQTQTDLYSVSYKQTYKLGRVATQEPAEAEAEREEDDKLSEGEGLPAEERPKPREVKRPPEDQKLTILAQGLQETLMNVCKVLVVKFRVVHMVEAAARSMWKRALVWILGKTGGQEQLETYIDLKKNGVKLIARILLAALNRFKYNVTPNDVYRFILVGKIPLKRAHTLLGRRVLLGLTPAHGPPRSRHRFDPISDNKFFWAANNLVWREGEQPGAGDWDRKTPLDFRVFCRRIVFHLRLPSQVLFVADRLVNYLFGGGGRAELAGLAGSDAQFHASCCAVVLVACRFLWPIFHTQPPNTPTFSGRDAETQGGHHTPVNLKSVTKEIDKAKGAAKPPKVFKYDRARLARVKRFIMTSQMKTNFNTFLLCLVHRYTSNYLFLNKLLTVLGEDPSSEERITRYLNLIGHASFEGSPAEERQPASGRGPLADLARSGLPSSREVFYAIVSLFNNCPRYSGFSPEKALEFSHFMRSPRTEKRNALRMASELKLVRLVESAGVSAFANVINGIENLANAPPASDPPPKSPSRDKHKRSKPAPVARGPERVNLFEDQMRRINGLFQGLGTITETGQTLPAKLPTNIRGNTSSGFPVLYLVTLNTVANFAGVSKFKVHRQVHAIEAVLTGLGG